MEKIPVRSLNSDRTESNSQDSFNIREIVILDDGTNPGNELHRHDFYFVLAIRKGGGVHEIDFQGYEVSDHSVFFLKPGQVHQVRLHPGTQGYVMQFNHDFFYPDDKFSRQLLRKASSQNLYLPPISAFVKIQSVLTDIFKEYSEKQQGYRDVIKANLTIFLTELARNQPGSSSGINDHTYSQQRLDEFLELLETHISRCKQVAQYADMMNLSSYQLNAITKSSLGKTCSELINDYTILEAKRHLLGTSNQVNQIAFQLGYEDVSYFIRFFKKRTGQSPELFRQNFG